MNRSSFFTDLKVDTLKRLQVLQHIQHFEEIDQADWGLAFLLRFHLTQTFNPSFNRNVEEEATRFIQQVRSSEITFPVANRTPLTTTIHAPSAVGLISQLEKGFHRSLYVDPYFRGLIEPANQLFQSWNDPPNDRIRALECCCAISGVILRQSPDPFDYLGPDPDAGTSVSTGFDTELARLLDQLSNTPSSAEPGWDRETVVNLCQRIREGDAGKPNSFYSKLKALSIRQRWEMGSFLRRLAPLGLDLLISEVEWECDQTAVWFPEVTLQSIMAPPVTLGASMDDPVFVCGRRKSLCSENHYAVIEALHDAYPEGLTKDELERIASNARPILRELVKDPDWKKVLNRPGAKGRGGYRIVQPQ